MAGVDYLAKPNVRLVGAALPNFKSDFSALENGTVIQGPFYWNADGAAPDLFGVDSGAAVCDALYGTGQERDGLVIGQISQPSPRFMKNVQIGKVRGLARGPAALVHGILVEAITEGSFQFMEGANAFHAAVIKSSGLRGQYFGGYEANGESAILKSDSYAPMGNLQIDQVYGVNGIGAKDSGFGLLIDAVSSPGTKIQIGSANVVGKANGLGIRSNGASLTDVDVGALHSEGCDVGIVYSGDVRRTKVRSANILNSVYGVITDAGVTSLSNSIDTISINGATDGFNMQGVLRVGHADFENVSNQCVNYTAVAARLLLGGKRFGPSVASFWNQQVALVNSWVNDSSATPFIISQSGNRITLSGWIRSGTSATVATLTTQTRPTSNKRFAARGLNGSSEVSVTVLVNASTGALTIPDYASAPTLISLDGIEWDAP